jgi:hypothetical protein
MTLCHSDCSSWCFAGTAHVQHIAKHSPNDTVLHLRRIGSLATLLWEPLISRRYEMCSQWASWAWSV